VWTYPQLINNFNFDNYKKKGNIKITKLLVVGG